MRFARKPMVAPGPLDAAAVAGVFFLLLIFLLMLSLQFTPGVLMDVHDGLPTETVAVMIAADGSARLGTATYATNELGRLRKDLQRTNAMRNVGLAVEPGAPAEVTNLVRSWFQINLPAGDLAVPDDTAKAVVAVNFRGQYFYENRIIGTDDLKVRLKEQLQEAGRKELTLIVCADKSVEFEQVSRLSHLADEVGIKRVLLAEQPNPYAAREGGP